VIATQQGDLRELSADLVDLAVNAGIMGSIMNRYPLEVQEGWDERIAEIRSWVQDQTRQIQQFGEAYDE
jgi:hypothetical protein